MYMYMCVCACMPESLSVQQKLTRHCKSTIIEKIKIFKKLKKIFKKHLCQG